VAATAKSTTLQVNPADLAGMRTAAAVIKEIRAAVAGNAGGILGTLASDIEAPVPWQHYPAGDIYDPLTHAQYFFHAHPLRPDTAREHGHFHTFLRAEGMPTGVSPLILPETAVAAALPVAPQAAPLKRGQRDEVSHLVAVAVDAGGEPVRLFTTNRWVTGESWYSAEDVIRMLGHFTLAGGDGPSLVNRWLSAVMALFRPQIASLLRLRDEAVIGWRRRRRTNVFEDSRLEITSSFDVDLDTQLASLDRLDDRRAAHHSVGPAPRSPIAEGWDEGWAS
jgi:hypothetical protein